jgi:hypothetical protein
MNPRCSFRFASSDSSTRAFFTNKGLFLGVVQVRVVLALADIAVERGDDTGGALL